SYNIYLGDDGSKTANYVVTIESFLGAFRIVARELSVTLDNEPPIAKVYDGFRDIVLAEGNYNLHGLISGDDVSITGTSVFDTETVGNDKTVTATDFAIAGEDSGNYILSTLSATTTGDILPGSASRLVFE